MTINWDSIGHAQQPGREIASISNMLSAFAENRERQRQQQIQNEMAERKFQQEQREAQAREEYNRGILGLQREQHEERKRSALAEEQQKQQEKAYAARPRAEARLRVGDVQGARSELEPLGGGVDVDEEHRQRSEEALANRAIDTTEKTQPLREFVPQAFGLAGIVPALASDALIDAAVTPTQDEAQDRYKMRMPAGNVLDFSPLEAERAEQAQADAERAFARRNLAGSRGLPGGEAAAVEAEDVAALQGRDKAGAQFSKAREGELDRQAAMERARVSASGRDRQRDLGEGRLDLAKGGYAWNRAKDVLSTLGAKEVILQDRKYSDMAAQLSSDPNAALDAALAGTWTKLAQGGTGVISDQDMNVFWRRIGGTGERVEGKIQEIINGQITAGKRKEVGEAVQWLAGRAKSNLAGVRSSMRSALENDTRIPPDARDAIFKTYGISPKASPDKVKALGEMLKELKAARGAK